MKVICVLPTYNEAENIGWLIKELLGLELSPDVLVIDDSSPDGTAQKAKAAGPPDKVQVVIRPEKGGLGSAQRAGMKRGVEQGYDLVVVMDADGSHAPSSVPDLVAAASECDVAIGSRYIPGGGVENWAWHRLLLSRTANLLARLLLGWEIRDWTSSFRCYRREVLESLPLDRFKSDGYAFAEEMLFECKSRGWRLKEVPIRFVERRAGRSKIDRREILSAAFRLFAMAFKRLIRSPLPSKARA